MFLYTSIPILSQRTKHTIFQTKIFKCLYPVSDQKGHKAINLGPHVHIYISYIRSSPTPPFPTSLTLGYKTECSAIILLQGQGSLHFIKPSARICCAVKRFAQDFGECQRRRMYFTSMCCASRCWSIQTDFRRCT